MSLNQYDAPVAGSQVQLTLRRGTNLNVFDLTTAGKGPGGAIVHFSFKVRLQKLDDGSITGDVVEYPVTSPADWVVRPVVDSTLTGATVTLAPNTAVWRTAIRPELITTL